MCFGIKGEIVKLEEGNSKTGKGELSNGEGGALKRGRGSSETGNGGSEELLRSVPLGAHRFIYPKGDKAQPTGRQNATHLGTKCNLKRAVVRASRHIFFFSV